VIEVSAVSPSDPAARQLLTAYVEELNRRVPEEAHDAERGWSECDYGGARGRVFVARLDGMPVACAGLREHARSAGEIKRFYVALSARRLGVGRSLLASMERAARELGYRRLLLDTAAPLIEAARLYEASGYTRVAPFNDKPHATLWLEKVFPLDDIALWGAFQHVTLPHAEWTHRSHVRTAFLHLARWGIDEAHLRMRVGIIRLNLSHGLEETPDRGYHETLTRAWILFVASARRDGAHAGSEAWLAAHPELLDKHLALRFYSRQRLFSLRARAVFVDPDIAPLPNAALRDNPQ
jgi:GNAT superfamily N-acetyltransferase